MRTKGQRKSTHAFRQRECSYQSDDLVNHKDMRDLGERVRQLSLLAHSRLGRTDKRWRYVISFSCADESDRYFEWPSKRSSEIKLSSDARSTYIPIERESNYSYSFMYSSSRFWCVLIDVGIRDELGIVGKTVSLSGWRNKQASLLSFSRSVH